MNDSNNTPNDVGIPNSYTCLMSGKAFERHGVSSILQYWPEREQPIIPCRTLANKMLTPTKGQVQTIVALPFLCKHVPFEKTHRIQLSPLPHPFCGVL